MAHHYHGNDHTLNGIAERFAKRIQEARRLRNNPVPRSNPRARKHQAKREDFKGNWRRGDSYDLGNIVTFHNGQYICVKPTPASYETPPVEHAVWSVWTPVLEPEEDYGSFGTVPSDNQHISLRYCGAWKRGKYFVGDICFHSNKYWLCVEDISSQYPPMTFMSDSQYWDEYDGALPGADASTWPATPAPEPTPLYPGIQGYGAGLDERLPHSYNCGPRQCHNCDIVGVTHAHAPGTTFEFGCNVDQVKDCIEKANAARRGPTGPVGPDGPPTPCHGCVGVGPCPQGEPGVQGWSGDAILTAGINPDMRFCSMCNAKQEPDKPFAHFIMPVWQHAVEGPDNTMQVPRAAMHQREVPLCEMCTTIMADFFLFNTYPQINNPTMSVVFGRAVEHYTQTSDSLLQLFASFGVQVMNADGTTRAPVDISSEFALAWLKHVATAFQQIQADRGGPTIESIVEKAKKYAQPK